MQAPLRSHRGQFACGDDSYSKAVLMAVTWAEAHELIADPRNPEKLRQAGVAAVRQVKVRRVAKPDPLDLPRIYEMTERLDGEKQFLPRHALPRPWQAAAKMLRDA